METEIKPKSNSEKCGEEFDEMWAEKKKRIEKQLEQRAVDKDNRRSMRYVREVPQPQAARDFYLKEGRTPEKEPWYFEPTQHFISWKYDEVLDSYKARHGSMPPPDAEGVRYAYRESVPEEITESIRYPVEVWDGTFFGEWAKIGANGNFIPAEYFIESLKTMIGAIAGHRIVDVESPSQENRFYTVLLSEEGGIGKSTANQWAEQMLAFGGLLTRSGLPKLGNIGAHCDAFSSGRAMVEGFEQQPRIIQIYDELASFVDSLAVTGAGQSLLAHVNTMYDSSVPAETKIKGKKEGTVGAPKEGPNSILACSIIDKWNAMFGGTSADNSGFFQRLNIIASNETRTVPKLKTPIEEMVVLGERIAKKVMALNYQKLTVRDTPEATALFNEWFEDFKKRTKEDSADVRGRLNVLVQRNKNILAWAHEDFDVTKLNLPAGVKGSIVVNFKGEDPGPQYEPERLIEVSADVMAKAIKIPEYQLLVLIATN